MNEQLNFDFTKYHFQPIGKATELPSGERLLIEVNGLPIVVLNVGGHYFAIDDLCTHDDGTLSDGDLNSHVITCPRHGAEFDIRTGKVLTLPAVFDVQAFPVQISGDILEIGIPD